MRLVRALSTLLPIVCLVLFVVFPESTTVITIAGMAQALMLPMLGFAAIWFRFHETDLRLRQGRA